MPFSGLYVPARTNLLGAIGSNLERRKMDPVLRQKLIEEISAARDFESLKTSLLALLSPPAAVESIAKAPEIAAQPNETQAARKLTGKGKQPIGRPVEPKKGSLVAVDRPGPSGIMKKAGLLRRRRRQPTQKPPESVRMQAQ